MPRLVHCLLSALLSVQCVWATEKRDIIGYFEYFPPFAMAKEGKITGIHVEAILPLLRQAGFNVEPELYPWKRVYQSAVMNENSFLFPVARMPQREADFNWIAKLDSLCPSIIGLKNDANDGAQINIQNKSIALVRSDYSAIRALQDKLVNEEKVLWVADHYAMLDLLLKKRVELIAGDLHQMNVMLEYSGYDKNSLVSVFNMSHYNTDLYFVVHPLFSSVDLKNIRHVVNTAVNEPGGLLFSKRTCPIENG